MFPETPPVISPVLAFIVSPPPGSGLNENVPPEFILVAQFAVPSQ